VKERGLIFLFEWVFFFYVCVCVIEEGKEKGGAHTGIDVRRRRRRRGACMHNIKLNRDWVSEVYLLLSISFAFVCVCPPFLSFLFFFS